MMYILRGRRPLAAAAAMLAALAAGCTDSQTPTAVAAAPSTSEHAAAKGAGIVHESPILLAFDVQLSASGSMQPGKPIEVHLRVNANLPVDDAEIVLATPDLDRPLAPTLSRRYVGAMRDQKIGGRKLERRARWQKGQGLNETVRLNIPAPGYYRVTASAFARSPLPAFVDSAEVVANIHREIWIRVDKRGGRYTAQFDTTVFPAEAERRPGPLHCTVDLDEERRGKKRDAGCEDALVTLYDPARNPDGAVGIQVGPGEVCLMSMDTSCGGYCDGTSYCENDPCLLDPYACGGGPYTPPAPVDPCYAGTHLCLEFVYLNHYTGQWTPAPEGVQVEASYQDRDCFVTCWWEEEYSNFLRTDNAGKLIVRCPSSSTEKRLRTVYEFLDDFTAVSRSEWDAPTVRGACPTGWRRVEMAANQEAFVFGNMRKSAQHAQVLFGRTSPRVRVDFDGGMWQNVVQIGSWYDAPAHVISINDDNIWTPGTHPHEYGHSFHNRALGGIGHIYISSMNPSHQFTSESNGAKALLEGFAEFFGSLTLPGVRGEHRGVRWPQHYTSPLPYGPASEARVAAYLWDVIDDASEKGSAYEYQDWGTVLPLNGYALETWDAVQISPSGLGWVMDNCGSPSWGILDTRPESVGGIHTCLKAYAGSGATVGLNRIYARDIYGTVE